VLRPGMPGGGGHSRANRAASLAARRAAPLRRVGQCGCGRCGGEQAGCDELPEAEGCAVQGVVPGAWAGGRDCRGLLAQGSPGRRLEMQVQAAGVATVNVRGTGWRWPWHRRRNDSGPPSCPAALGMSRSIITRPDGPQEMPMLKGHGSISGRCARGWWWPRAASSRAGRVACRRSRTGRHASRGPRGPGHDEAGCCRPGAGRGLS
jgi:hypothetical protein